MGDAWGLGWEIYDTPGDTVIGHDGITLADLGEAPSRVELVAYEDGMLIARDAKQGLHMPHAFTGDDGAGHAQYLHIGRVMPRASAELGSTASA